MQLSIKIPHLYHGEFHSIILGNLLDKKQFKRAPESPEIRAGLRSLRRDRYTG
jgi:hypothetical protein